MSPTASSFSSLHPDIICSHILNRLEDGPSLAFLSSASSQLQSLCYEETLWRNICLSRWPSCNHLLMRQLISNFPNKHRSFFSNSFPLLITVPEPPPETTHPSPQPKPKLVSAVDIHHRNKLIFSQVQETQTVSRMFNCSPFRLNLLDPKNVVPTPIQASQDIFQNLGEDLTLSWIIIIGQKAANFSSCTPVSVHRNLLTNEIRLKFATVISVNKESDVLCEITVTLESEMELSEVSMHVENMDGITLNGESSLEILQRAILTGERRMDRSEERTERYQNYMKKAREMKMRTQWASVSNKLWNFLAKLVCITLFRKI